MGELRATRAADQLDKEVCRDFGEGGGGDGREVRVREGGDGREVRVRGGGDGRRVSGGRGE